MLETLSLLIIAGYATWGAVVGLVVGFTAIGTGLLGTPGLIILFALDPVTAVGTMSVAAVVMMGAGAAAHGRENNIHLPISLLFLLTAIPASYAAARYARRINDLIPLETVVGVVIVVSVVLLFYRYVIMRPRPRELRVKRRHLAAAPVLGLLLGVLMGATSISGSIIIISFILILKLPAPYAVGSTTLVTMVSLFVASIAHVQSGNVNWIALIGLLPGVLVGSVLGARFVNRVPREVLRIGILVILFAAGVMVFLN